MNKQDKELLLKVLCAGLSYGIFVREEIPSLLEEPVIYTYDYHPHITECKPYLRPMSSMTEEERDEYTDIKKGECNGCVLTGKGDPDTEFLLVDWLNTHHFDYRGLIPKGLALKAPEGMYNI